MISDGLGNMWDALSSRAATTDFISGSVIGYIVDAAPEAVLRATVAIQDRVSEFLEWASKIGTVDFNSLIDDIWWAFSAEGAQAAFAAVNDYIASGVKSLIDFANQFFLLQPLVSAIESGLESISGFMERLPSIGDVGLGQYLKTLGAVLLGLRAMEVIKNRIIVAYRYLSHYMGVVWAAAARVAAALVSFKAVGIYLLVEAVIQLSQNWDALSESVVAFWETLKGGDWSEIMSGLSELAPVVKDLLGDIFANPVTMGYIGIALAARLGPRILAALVGMAPLVAVGISSAFALGIGGAAAAILSTTGIAISAAFAGALALLSSKGDEVNALFGDMLSSGTDLLGGIGQVITGFISGNADAVTEAQHRISKALAGIWDSISGLGSLAGFSLMEVLFGDEAGRASAAIGKISEGITNAVVEMGSFLKTLAIKAMISDPVIYAAGVIDELTDTLRGAAVAALEWLASFDPEGLKANIQALWLLIKVVSYAALDWVKSFAVVQWIMDVTSDSVQALRTSIADLLEWVGQIADIDFGTAIPDFFKDGSIGQWITTFLGLKVALRAMRSVLLGFLRVALYPFKIAWRALMVVLSPFTALFKGIWSMLTALGRVMLSIPGGMAAVGSAAKAAAFSLAPLGALLGRLVRYVFSPANMGLMLLTEVTLELYRHWDSVSEAIGAFWTALKSGDMEAIKAELSDLAAVLKDVFADVFDNPWIIAGLGIMLGLKAVPVMSAAGSLAGVAWRGAWMVAVGIGAAIAKVIGVIATAGWGVAGAAAGAAWQVGFIAGLAGLAAGVAAALTTDFMGFNAGIGTKERDQQIEDEVYGFSPDVQDRLRSMFEDYDKLMEIDNGSGALAVADAINQLMAMSPRYNEDGSEIATKTPTSQGGPSVADQMPFKQTIPLDSTSAPTLLEADALAVSEQNGAELNARISALQAAIDTLTGKEGKIDATITVKSLPGTQVVGATSSGSGDVKTKMNVGRSTTAM